MRRRSEAAQLRAVPPDDPESGASRTAGLRYPGFGALFLIWTAVGALASARYIMIPSKLEAMDLAHVLASVVGFWPGIALSAAAFRLEARFPLGDRRWFGDAALLAAISVPLCLLASPLMFGGFLAVLSAFGKLDWWPPTAGFWFVDVPIAETMFWCSVAGGYVIRTRFELREHERQTARLALEKSQLEAGLNQAQLEVLRAKLNPHFLFNSLHNISVMTREDPQIASGMIARLGDLLRAVLRHDSQPETTLEDEVELTRSYVELERMRFGDRLNVGFDIAGDVQRALVPSFILQPLIENAVVHGLKGTKKTGVITVSARADARTLVLSVTDNGVGLPEQDGGDIKVGVGLGSTGERLAKMYGDRHTFSVRTSPDGGAEVLIAIPLRFSADDELPHSDEQPAAADR